MTERPTDVSGPTPQSRTETRWAYRSAMLALAGAGMLSLIACSNSRATSTGQSKAVPAHIYRASEETTLRKVQAVGSLFALEESALSSEVEARVDEVLADVGDRVTEGQALIVLDKRELQF